MFLTVLALLAHAAPDERKLELGVFGGYTAIPWSEYLGYERHAPCIPGDPRHDGVLGVRTAWHLGSVAAVEGSVHGYPDVGSRWRYQCLMRTSLPPHPGERRFQATAGVWFAPLRLSLRGRAEPVGALGVRLAGGVASTTDGGTEGGENLHHVREVRPVGVVSPGLTLRLSERLGARAELEVAAWEERLEPDVSAAVYRTSGLLGLSCYL